MTPTWLVAHDFSPCAEAALELAASELAPRNGRIVLVHAWHIPVPAVVGEPSVASTLAVSWPDIEAAVSREASEHLDAIAARTRAEFPGVRIETRAVPGRPTEMILGLAEAERAQRIVVGTHGRHGLGHLFLGSVASRVARLAPVPVLVVKASREHLAAETPPEPRKSR